MSKRLALCLAAAVLTAPVAFGQKKAKGKNKQAATAAPAPKPASPPILTIGGREVPANEFEYVYKKNNSNAEDAFTEKSVREYVDLYTNFRLKVMDAERLKMDTSESFKQELEGYRRQLAQPYLTEKSVTEKLIREAYDRMKQEVHAEHILLTIDPQADPKDTQRVYQQAIDLRNRALKGEKFEELAKQNSQDPSAKQNGGDLGYFSSMQMVYPFESAAYNTPVGQVSMPVRTRFGYHLVKVLDRRPSQGQVRVAHIMVRANPGMPAEDSVAAKKKIDEIYTKLKKGEGFSGLAMAYSEDPGSKDQGGNLPAFSTGSMIPSFEDAAFALKDTGSYSAPFQTPYGWHIVKLQERKGLDSYEEMEPTLKTKVSRDSRSELNRSELLKRLRKENQLVENTLVRDKALAKADTAILKGRWRYKRNEKGFNLKDNLFTVGGQGYSVEDFFDYAEKSQAPNEKSTPQYLMRLLYNQYVDDKLLKYEEAHLSDKYEDYRMLYKEYRDGILLFSLMDQKVWTKAMEDTTGLKKYYGDHKDTYKWDTRADAVIYNVADQKTLDEVLRRSKEGSYATGEQVTSVAFEKGQSKIPATARVNVRQIINTLVNDDKMTVELTGYAEGKEKKSLALTRARVLRDSVIKGGIAAARVKIKDGGVLAATEKAENAKATATYYSPSLKVLERQMNQKSALAVQITEGKFQKGDNPVMDKIPAAQWKPGNVTIKDDPTGKGRITYVEIKSIEQPRPKTLDEARGLVISDYQNQLEKEWVAELRSKSPVVVNEAEVKKLIRK